MAGDVSVERGLSGLEELVAEDSIHYPEPKAAIFDMDGLLVDSERYWRSVELEIFDALGADVRPLLLRNLTKGMRVDEVVAFFRDRVGWRDGDDDAEVARRIVSGVIAEIEQGAELKPGALDAVARMERHGLALGLASGSGVAVIDAVLDRFSLRDHFAYVASALDDALGKPHPAVFLRTAAALGVDPLSCIVLEDSLNGCIAAKAARMRVVAVPEGHSIGDVRFSIADVELTSLEQFDERVDKALGLGRLAQ